MDLAHTHWQLAEPSVGLFVWAETDALWLHASGIDLSDSTQVNGLQPQNRLGTLIPSIIPQLVQLGMAHFANGSVCIPYENLDLIGEQGIDAFEDLANYSPFLLSIETTGALGLPEFKYRCDFYHGRSLVAIERIGCFVRWKDQIYRLDRQTYLLISAIHHHNSTPAAPAGSSETYLSFAKIKGIAVEVAAQLDQHIMSQRVVVPSKIGIEVTLDSSESITFTPIVEDVDRASLMRAFLRQHHVTETYVVEDQSDGNLFVVLSEEQREVLRRMQKVRRVRGPQKAKILANPCSVFDGVAGAVDLSDFGPRVRAIGEFPFVAQPFYRLPSTGVLDGLDAGQGAAQGTSNSGGITFRDIEGLESEVTFESRQEVVALFDEARQAYDSGRNLVEFRGRTIVVDQLFVKGLKELVETIKSDPRHPTHKSSDRKYLLIYTNLDQLEFEASETKVQKSLLSENNAANVTDSQLLRALKESNRLKTHQTEGVRWLWRNYMLGRSGCLLADDMGLGKTLQVLTFLSWVIESDEFLKGKSNDSQSALGPVLIVAPKILLDNATWINDMHTFFMDKGSVFTPYITLRDKELSRFKATEGRETDLARTTLDTEALRKYRVVLTNYETVVNYQYSFAAIKGGWSVIVTDEAQEYKTPNTKVSHAVKALQAKFRIACTGTPVETRLMDLWNIFDFLQPGELLGSANDFRNRFEKPIEQDSENTSASLDSLRKVLRYNTSKSFILRREKVTQLPDLPRKYEHDLTCHLSTEQRELHMAAINDYGRQQPFKLLHQLMKLYQHPALIEKAGRFDLPTVDDSLNDCPKLQCVVSKIREISRKGEKVLIFARLLQMQAILKKVIDEQFGLNCNILNGSVSSSGDKEGVRRTRKGIIESFQGGAGFDALILSPEVAGVGLTITEANHVIHYGRWWNPAREAQATDRVYRIGQERDVHVYYPIAKDPQDQFPSFDEKLDALVRRRRDFAYDFLKPQPSEDVNQHALVEGLVTSAALQFEPTVSALKPDDIGSLTWQQFEALVACFESAAGAYTLLTPQSGDGGFDVVAIKDGVLSLIQCKHSKSNFPINRDVINEMLLSVDQYRDRLRSALESVPLNCVLVTNGLVEDGLRSDADSRGIKIIGPSALRSTLTERRFSFADIHSMESERLTSLSAVFTAIRDRLQH